MRPWRISCQSSSILGRALPAGRVRVLLLVALLVQLRVHKYVPSIYWVAVVLWRSRCARSCCGTCGGSCGARSSGLALGAILGAIGFLRIVVWSQFSAIYGAHYLLVALAVGVSLIGIVLWGALAGAMLPFIPRRFGLGPRGVFNALRGDARRRDWPDHLPQRGHRVSAGNAALDAS